MGKDRGIPGVGDPGQGRISPVSRSGKWDGQWVELFWRKTARWDWINAEIKQVAIP